MNETFDKLVQKTLELVGIDSVQAAACKRSPFGKGVADCLDLVCATAKDMGMKVHNEQGYYCTCDIGEGETFGILGHIDVVPYDKNEWSANPLGEIKDGYLYGRGVLDDKGPMLACLYAVDALVKEGYKSKNKIRFIFGGNEESGWKCIEHYNQVDKMPEKGFSPDGDFPVINCEKGLVGYSVSMDMPKKLLFIEGGDRVNVVMAKCTAVLDMALDADGDDKLVINVKDGKTHITAYGTPAHASTPQKGDNAFWRLMNFLAEKVGGEFKTVRDKLCHNDGSGAGIRLSDEKSGALTFNVGVVSGENLPSTRLYNRKMKLLIDVRHPVTYTKEEIADKLAKNLDAQVEIRNYHDPLYIDKNNPLVKKLLASYNKVTGEHASPITIGGGTYARALKCGVAFGPIFPGQESTIHQTDERVSLADFKKLYDVYYSAIKDLLFE